MIIVSLTEARARLPELLTRAAEGEEVHITRHGRSEAVLVSEARWVRTKQHDILLRAQELGRRLDEARSAPLPDLPIDAGWDAEAHVADVREGREKDAWERVRE